MVGQLKLWFVARGMTHTSQLVLRARISALDQAGPAVPIHPFDAIRPGCMKEVFRPAGLCIGQPEFHRRALCANSQSMSLISFQRCLSLRVLNNQKSIQVRPSHLCRVEVLWNASRTLTHHRRTKHCGGATMNIGQFGITTGNLLLHEMSRGNSMICRQIEQSKTTWHHLILSRSNSLKKIGMRLQRTTNGLQIWTERINLKESRKRKNRLQKNRQQVTLITSTMLRQADLVSHHPML